MIREFVVKQKKKVIIFSGFDQALNLCEDHLNQTRRQNGSFNYARIDGSTPSAWRNLGVYLFNNDPRYMVFLISIRAGGEGLNLASASVVIFLDEDWNPQVMKQAEARVHRLGQTKKVTIYKMHSRGTVEDQMMGRLAKKSYLAAKVTENIKTFNPLDDLASIVETQDALNNTNGSAAIIAGFITSLMRQRRLAASQIDTKKLLSWDWNTVLEVCTDNHLDEFELPDTVPEDMERAWLRSKERIITNVFNGVSIKTPRMNEDDEVQPELRRADRRIGKERVIKVDGYYPVTKENLRLGMMEPPSPKSPSNKKALTVHYSVSFIHSSLITNF